MPTQVALPEITSHRSREYVDLEEGELCKQIPCIGDACQSNKTLGKGGGEADRAIQFF